jgi:hypothetical protein
VGDLNGQHSAGSNGVASDKPGPSHVAQPARAPDARTLLVIRRPFPSLTGAAPQAPYLTPDGTLVVDEAELALRELIAQRAGSAHDDATTCYTTEALLDDCLAERKARTRATATLDFIAKHSKTLRRRAGVSGDMAHARRVPPVEPVRAVLPSGVREDRRRRVMLPEKQRLGQVWEALQEARELLQEVIEDKDVLTDRKWMRRAEKILRSP